MLKARWFIILQISHNRALIDQWVRPIVTLEWKWEIPWHQWANLCQCSCFSYIVLYWLMPIHKWNCRTGSVGTYRHKYSYIVYVLKLHNVSDYHYCTSLGGPSNTLQDIMSICSPCYGDFAQSGSRTTANIAECATLRVSSAVSKYSHSRGV